MTAQLRALEEKNRSLQQQVAAQQQALDALAAQLSELRRGAVRHDQELRELRENGSAGSEPAPAARRGAEIRLSGETGLALFSTGRDGAFPKPVFRPDDPKLFVEAPVLKDVYAFGELDILDRESITDGLELGELYVDFENVSGRLGGPEQLLNVRVGRFNTPFGEEYQLRGPLANPLISHSAADLWGVDGGVEAYGSSGAWQYAVAVQNGGINILHDFNADKAVTARIGWDPAQWLHLSTSAMRTGELRVASESAPGDSISNLWFGNGFFRSLGAGYAPSKFWVSLWEGDAVGRWKGGQLSASVGGARYGDNSRISGSERLIHFGFLEATQLLTPKLGIAARHSWINAPGGYPMVGMGPFGRAVATTDLRRTSLGFAYHFGPPLVLKLEHAWEGGHTVAGAPRGREDFFGAEVGMRF